LVFRKNYKLIIEPIYNKKIMKKIATLFITSMLLVNFCVLGQIRQKIGSNTTNIAVSATLEIESTTGGFLPSRMTYLQRNAIVSPVAGLIVWCTDCSTAGEFQVYNGTTWTNIIGGTASLPAPTVTTTAITSITGTTASFGGTVTATGGAAITAQGVCWSTTTAPTISNSKTTDGTTTPFTSSITGLAGGTTYYVRAYATNSIGTTYGNEISFTTLAAPTVTTTAITSITASTASSGGTITATGGAAITAQGVCWSTTTAPTISNSKTTDGTTTPFTSSITGLTNGTTYYVRAYATNSVGTSYGNEISFTATASIIVTNGLKLNLDASSTSSYIGTGTTWTDLSGNGNHGTLINGTTFSSVNGGTMVFDGIDDRVQTSLNPTLTDFTVCVWFKDNGSTTYGRLVDNNYVNGFQLSKNGNTPNEWGGGIRESTNPYGIYLTLTDGQWHFLTSTRSGTTHTLYGDGISNKISNTVSGAALNGTTISIGEWSGGGNGQLFKGNIPQVLIYDRALSEAEIMQLFNATKSKYGFLSAPTVTTTAITSITATTASSGGTVTATGGAAITAQGVCWSTTSGPTTANSKTTDGTTTPFTSSITGLTAGTTYYVRAYATNSVGTSYGNEISFTTVASVPGAPTIGMATFGYAKATIAFTAPVSNGGSAITSYTVTSSPGGFIASGASSPLTVTGLTNGTAYTFTVTATNAIGNSVASTASVAVTPNCFADVGGTIKVFMCYNLGVTGTQDPLSYQGGANNGALYQWGRQTDGHEVRTSATQAGPVAGAVAGKFITISDSSNDWISPQNSGLWLDASKTANDPCPSGFRVPTQAQWGGLFRDGITSGAPETATRNTWTWTGNGYTVGANLYLPAAGGRLVNDATLNAVDYDGYYWSSTFINLNVYSLGFNINEVDPGLVDDRGYGNSVRCISE
jgi:uncharacterized protein (TIGR02145 family)